MDVLKQQIALVTGASRGIGKGIALELAKCGAQVIGTSTSDKGAEAINELFSSATVLGKGVVLNVNNGEQVDALIDDIQKQFGNITILVNNAGITQDNIAVRMREEEWDNVVDTDLKAVFRLSRAVLRGMMKVRQGRIINITSVVGHTGNPGQINYAAAKAGVEGLTRALAREVGSRNITVNCVAPGFIDTDMTKVLNDEHKKMLLQQIPLGRLGQVNDVVSAVLFLASPQAGYVTGTTIHVNGGMFMN